MHYCSITEACNIRDLEVTDVKELALLYSTAFADNPAYSYIFQYEPQSENHFESLFYLFEKRIQVLLSVGAKFLVAVTNSKIVGAVALCSKDKKPSLWKMASVGLFNWPLYWGFSSLFRALDLDQINEYGAEYNYDAELMMMAVSPHFQGKGIGNDLLKVMLQQHGPKFSIILSTQRESNVNFYNKHGFTVVTKSKVKDFDNWKMHRPPISSSSTT